MSIYLKLFLSFLQIGITSFGGLSMVPLINEQMLTNGWMTSSEVSDIVAFAEMTPGPLGLNCATFAGMRVAGLLGALAANLGVAFPTLSITLIAAIFFVKFRDSKILKNAMCGLRPACLGLIVSVLLSLTLTNYLDQAGAISYSSIVIGLIDIFFLFKLQLSVPLVIIFSGVAGIVSFQFLGL